MDEAAVVRSLQAGGARKRKPFGPRGMAAVVKALEAGATVKAAAQASGYGLSTVYDWRRRSEPFAAACASAIEASRAPVLVTGGKNRTWRIARPRRQAFSRERKVLFLEHFAATCDATASAEAAGVCLSTVYSHLKSDPVFAEGWREALALGYQRLEAEALRQRLAAMAKIEFRGDKEVPGAAAEFDRTLSLLREYKRTLAGLGKAGSPPTRWRFDEALDALEKQLKAFEERVARGEEEGDG